MSDHLPRLTMPGLTATHGFFSRVGGASSAPYDSLNGGWNTQDQRSHVEENIRRIADVMNVDSFHLLSVDQVHGVDVVTVRANTPLWSVQERPKADALVTDRPDVALAITTADCAPVLFASGDGTIVGAAHAGWRGAIAGVLEATVHHMVALGATDIAAFVGPCIGPASYEVGADMRQAVLEKHSEAESFFRASVKADHFMFDLPGFCVKLLEQSGVKYVGKADVDTLSGENYFSHRRATLAGSSLTGRQISAIRR
ncbi:peptidoglycan editing factor PgeF [Saccharibacter sp. 17.LH.SD]|uniref:peptidoglycan editing factor PgeF n=1 Tax=Saccharibacter sp. 17.LH.SD TaxID=2689393 RepID=UPI001369DFDA|nr:peptidoglycan editing factor PgeF [Saccharibacter sp. 17.LH.SD]MXV43681.1 peptidoglycan editing factor PgeF [Saccharibacter sp. 17.LH.SD]